MLSDFFRINLPYGMRKNASGEWFFFNREYVPLGWNIKRLSSSGNGIDPYSELPIYTKYKKLRDATLLKLAWDAEHGVQRNENGEIEKVFFYNDATNPQNDPKYWGQYFEKIKLLSKCDVKRVFA